MIVRGSSLPLLLLGGILCILFAATLGSYDVGSGDDVRVAGIAAEMFDRGEYLTPRLNGEPFLEYPPGYYWLLCGSFRLCGVGDAAAKLPAALLGILGALLLYALARELNFPRRSAFAAALILGTGAQFWSEGHGCRVDLLLAVSIGLALYGFAVSRRSGWGYLLFALGAAAGSYTKGLLGWGLPVAVAGTDCILNDVFDRKLHWKRYFALGAASLAALIPVASWYLLLRQQDEKLFITACWVNNFGRFLGSQGDHNMPWYYYLEKLPGLMQPWLVFVLAGAVFAVCRIKRGTGRRRRELFMLVYLVLPFLLFSAASAKRQVYLLPVAFPGALLAAEVLIWGVHRLARRWRRILVTAALAFLAAGAVAGTVAALLLHECILWPLLLAAGVIAAFAWRARRMALLCIAFALFYAMLDGVAVAHQSRADSLRPLGERCRELLAQNRSVILAAAPERTCGAVNFYVRRNLPLIPVARLGEYRSSFWITRLRDGSPETGERFGDDHYILAPGKNVEAFSRARHITITEEKP